MPNIQDDPGVILDPTTTPSSSSPFQFKMSDDLKPVSYEGVKVLSGTPKNPSDFHSVQDIIRYRQIMMVKELFGNCRIATDTTSQTQAYTIYNNQVKINGVWYLDGYRMELVDLLSNTTPVGQNFYVMLDVKFTTIDYTDDSSIAIKDPTTKKLIPTSQRLKFTYQLRAAISPSSDSSFDATYTLAQAIYSTSSSLDAQDGDRSPRMAIRSGSSGSGSLSFTDTYPQLSLDYATALDVIQRAVHFEDNGTVKLGTITMNGFTYWADSSGKLRMKTAATFIASDLTAPVGLTTVSPGGVYASVESINGMGGAATFSFSIDNGISVPEITNSPDVSSINLGIPNISNVNTPSDAIGLISKADYATLKETILLGDIDAGNLAIRALNGKYGSVTPAQNLAIAVNSPAIYASIPIAGSPSGGGAPVPVVWDTTKPSWGWNQDTHAHTLNFPDPSVSGSGLFTHANSLLLTSVNSGLAVTNAILSSTNNIVASHTTALAIHIALINTVTAQSLANHNTLALKDYQSLIDQSQASTNGLATITSQSNADHARLADMMPSLPAQTFYVAKSWYPVIGSPYFTSIQDAIDACEAAVTETAGGTVLVYPGSYAEDLVVTKPISIKAVDPGNTKLDGSFEFGSGSGSLSVSGAGVVCNWEMDIDSAMNTTSIHVTDGARVNAKGVIKSAAYNAICYTVKLETGSCFSLKGGAIVNKCGFNSPNTAAIYSGSCCVYLLDALSQALLRDVLLYAEDVNSVYATSSKVQCYQVSGNKPAAGFTLQTGSTISINTNINPDLV